MSEYATPLSERQRLSRRHRERYASDPDYRLRCINRGRVYRGLAPRSSEDEITTFTDGGRAAAAKGARDERGRFV